MGAPFSAGSILLLTVTVEVGHFRRRVLDASPGVFDSDADDNLYYFRTTTALVRLSSKQ